jgi:competence protein ComEC
MTAAALAFACGAALLQLQADLPSLAWAALLPALAVLSLKQRVFIVALALAAGFLWAAGWAHWRMAERLAPELEGRDLEVVGVVAGLPSPGANKRFEFEPESADAPLPRRLLVTWYEAPLPVHAGERWLFTLRLRRPHGHVNPHGFDYEAWLLERGIGATGYVRHKGALRRIGERNSFLDYVERAREAVRERFTATLGATPAAGVLAALAVGDQRSISGEEWRLFNRTGVTHLMSISGLHVTLVSGLAAWLVAAGWRRVPWLALRLPARKAGAATAIVAALAYTLLSGFAVPAQRTFWMVAVVAAALWAGRIATPWRTLALALAAVVLADPWAPLAPGLWLSFGAVALMFYVGAGWTGSGHWLAQWGRMQWAITLGLAPAALLLFGQVSLAGPLANAVAIPVVSVVVTPLALLAALLPFDFLLGISAFLVEILLQFLEWCAALPGALWQGHAPPPWSVPLALLGAAWMLAPRGVPWRASGVALMSPAFLLAPPAPVPGEAWITVLDVGQGLAVLARTARRTLLYDAGPAYGADADSGSRVLVPALRGAGLSRVDLMVLTHEDADHVGGALSVLESFAVDAIASSLPAQHHLHALSVAPRRCRAGEAWEWDGVRFEFLHPPAQAGAVGAPPARRNNQSCVLRVAAAGGAMLLTGDIERLSEESLLRQGKGIDSEILLVPHHGSRSSSSPEFLAAVRPRLAVVPVGYRSRFGHPAPEVLARYRAAGAQVFRTDLDGALHIGISENKIALVSERRRRARYWLQ